MYEIHDDHNPTPAIRAPLRPSRLSAHPDRPRRKQRLSASRWDFRKTLFRREPPSHPQLRLTPEGCQGKLRAGGGQQKGLRESDLEAERRCFPRFLFLVRVYNLYMKYMMAPRPPPEFAHLSAHPDRPRRKQRLSASRWDFRKTLFRREPPPPTLSSA